MTGKFIAICFIAVNDNSELKIDVVIVWKVAANKYD